MTDVTRADVRQAKDALLDAEKELDRVLELAVQQGAAFTDLAVVLGCTEAAVRLKAQRRGWYVAGHRRGRQGH